MSNLVKADKMELEVANTVDAWGGNEMSSNDIVIPKLLLQQSTSAFVATGKAKLGDYVDSVTGEVLGSVSQPVEVIPFHMEKFWVNQKFNGKRWEYVNVERMTISNQNLPWEFTGPKNEKMKRVYTYNFYVIIPGKTLPYMVSFSSTSAKAGKELATLMYTQNAINKLPPPAKTIGLGGKIDKNDDGTYAVKGVTIVRDSDPQEIALAFNWYNTIKQGGAQVDTSDGVPF